MDLTIFYGKIIGFYFIISSIAYFISPSRCKKTIHNIMSSYGQTAIMATLLLMIGFIIVITHNLWEDFFPLVVTIIGWIMMILGFFHIFFASSMEKFSKRFQKNHGNAWISAIFFIIGVYLIYMSFFVK